MIHDAEEFIRLRTSENPAEYLRAANEHAPLGVWLDVIARYAEMRPWVAHNKTVPVEILAILAQDASAEVRSWVAMKNKLPLELMSLLAKDKDETVRLRIVYNRNVPVDVLRKLADDKSAEISEHARKRIADLGV